MPNPSVKFELLLSKLENTGSKNLFASKIEKYGKPKMLLASLSLKRLISLCHVWDGDTYWNSIFQWPEEDSFDVDKLVYLKGFLGFPGGSDDKELSCKAGDLGLIPGLRRSPEEGNGNSIQYSCLENSMDWEAWRATIHGVTKSWTWLSD